MEDFIYIILLIAWAVFAFYRRSQKKAEAARQAASGPEEPREYKPMSTLEELLMGEEVDLHEEPAPKNAPPFIQPVKIPKMTETAFEKEYNLRGITSIEEMDKAFNITAVKESEISDGIELPEVIEKQRDDIRYNIKQAVIYSEILNRPYV